MNPQTKPLSETDLETYEAQRDLGAEILQAIREMKADQGQIVYSGSSNAKPRHKPTVKVL